MDTYIEDNIPEWMKKWGELTKNDANSNNEELEKTFERIDKITSPKDWLKELENNKYIKNLIKELPEYKRLRSNLYDKLNNLERNSDNAETAFNIKQEIKNLDLKIQNAKNKIEEHNDELYYWKARALGLVDYFEDFEENKPEIINKIKKYERI